MTTAHLKRLASALLVGAIVAFPLAAFADDHDHGDREHPEHHDHGRHEGWYKHHDGDVRIYEAPPVYQAPPPVVYAPAPVIVAPPAQLNVVVPIR